MASFCPLEIRIVLAKFREQGGAAVARIRSLGGLGGPACSSDEECEERAAQTPRAKQRRRRQISQGRRPRSGGEHGKGVVAGEVPDTPQQVADAVEGFACSVASWCAGWFMLPVLVAIITTLGSLIVTALSIAREREQGTFDQLLVSPLTPAYIMVGKTIPALLIAFGQATLIVAAAAVFVYRVPFHGSLLLLYVCMACYGLSLAGSACSSRRCARPSSRRSSACSRSWSPPSRCRGSWHRPRTCRACCRSCAWIDPLTHFIVIVKGIFLKGYGPDWSSPNLWPLLLIAAVTMSAAYWMFRRRVA